ncbi:S-layer homology domain-containing protein [Selenomonas ruminis]|uniref:S-layer homology domain-containing protein n=1 Tax=Selenomonas ruminis TaxID=2593411 RepID=A0A5D6VZY5_9FIRM|nr:S-layer homology domain-containing protein [Selenomonas sp. mPRGC5]TYZ20499.1 S-layer homology domain-containing protein [Selenomonas sp. mPRGC5]
MSHKPLILAATLAISALSAGQASANPFADVPADHWAYDAIEQLAADNIIEGYGDSTFRGERSITRYEMAQMTARAMAKSGVPSADKALIDKLSAEFSAELESLGVRVAELERNADKIKWSGVFAQKAMKGTSDQHTWWEKELFLNMDAQVNETWKVHAGIDTKWGTNDGWNSETSFSDAYGASNKEVSGMLYHFYAQGPVAKGATFTLGLFTPGLQEGVVGNARTKGGELDWNVGKTTFKAYGGNLHEKVSDLSSDWSDTFRRAGGRNDYTYVGTTDSGFADQRLRAWGVAVEHSFTDRTTAGLGYYNLDSPVAYGDSHLGIVAVNLRQRLSRNLELTGFYSHGNRGWQNKAYDIKLVYNGSPWGDKRYGGSLGYRYLGSDALIMTSIVNGSEKPGRKGVEASLWYHFTKNIQLQTYYLFNGRAIDASYDATHPHGTAYFANLLFSF